MFIRRAAEVQSFTHFSAEATKGVFIGRDVSDNTWACFGIIYLFLSALNFKLNLNNL